MTHGEEGRDHLAYALVQSDFDAVERDGLRAAWNDAGTAVRVRELGAGDEDVVQYDAEDLIRAESDREVRNARKPGET